MEKLKLEKESATKLRERKLLDWDDNYLLYRNKVKTNRLTQRHAVNIPLMKETIKTILAKIGEMITISWKELAGDEQKEIVYQEVWNDRVKRDKLEIQDSLDKKNVLLYGFSTTKLNLDDYGVCTDVLDSYDILFDPLMKPYDLESARYICHINIFKNVKEILSNPRYSKEGKENIKIWANTPKGIVQNQENRRLLNQHLERLKAMGASTADLESIAGGDVIVNLTEHFTNTWNESEKRWERRVVVYADDCVELMDEKLVDLIGVDFWPFVRWSEDPETNDIYPDSVADLVRVPNKVINIWFSQLIENRTLKNFQMHWFSPIQGYTAQTYTPGPGVMLPAPPGDDINKVIKPVQIDGLDDTLQAINAITSIVERGTGATAIEKGQPESGQQTLGEVKILVGKAGERATAMSKFYKEARYELAWKWNRMMHANVSKIKKLDLYKTGRNGKVFPNIVYRKDWVSEAGYEPMVESTTEQEVESTKEVQRFLFALKQFPNNVPLRKIAQKRILKVLKLSPEELKQIEEGEREAEKPAAVPSPFMNAQNNNQPPTEPEQSAVQDMEEIKALMQEI